MYLCITKRTKIQEVRKVLEFISLENIDMNGVKKQYIIFLYLTEEKVFYISYESILYIICSNPCFSSNDCFLLFSYDFLFSSEIHSSSLQFSSLSY